MTDALRRELFIGPGGAVARRVAIGHYPLFVSAESWLPEVREWRIDVTLPLDSGRAMEEDEARVRAAAGQDLHADCVDWIAPIDDVSEYSKRVIWLTTAITETQAFARDEAETIVAELPWARPGTVDYDIEIDGVTSIRNSITTLAILWAERRSLLARQRSRRETTYEE